MIQPASAHNITAQYEEGHLLRADETLSWESARDVLSGVESFWLGTVDRRGGPHLRPVLGVWVDDALAFSAGAGTGKARNLSRDVRASMTARTEGLDVVVEGEARRVTEEEQLQRVADAYRARYGWPVTVVEGAFDAPYGAPSAGPPPYQVYRLVPAVAYAFGTDEVKAPRSTRWRF